MKLYKINAFANLIGKSVRTLQRWDIELGQVSKIIIAPKDRLVRFGFEWFEAFSKKHGTKVEVMNQES